MITNYFLGLFASSCPSAFDIQCVTQHIKKKVSAQMNSKLLARFTEDEVRLAVGQIHPNKARHQDRTACLELSIKTYGILWGRR